MTERHPNRCDPSQGDYRPRRALPTVSPCTRSLCDQLVS